MAKLTRLAGKFLITVSLLTGTAWAQQDPVVKLDALCIDRKGLEKVLSQDYQETPMLIMISGRTLGDRTVRLATVLFVNANTRSWTLIEQWDENRYCMVAGGTDMRPYGEQPNRDRPAGG